MFKVICFLLIIFVSYSSSALSIIENKTIKGWQKSSVDHQKFVKKSCGSEIPVTIDTAMAKPFLDKHKSASAFCLAVLDAVRDVCDSDVDAKATIVTKIKNVKCIFDDKNPKSLSFKMEGSTFTSTMGINAVNIRIDGLKWLQQNL